MTPEEALAQAERKLGITASTWQRQAALRTLRGEQVHIVWGRKVGRTTFYKMLELAEAYHDA